MTEPSQNPHFVWPRISELADKAGVAPIGEDTWPLIGAYGSDGEFYDVEQVVEACRRLHQ